MSSDFAYKSDFKTYEVCVCTYSVGPKAFMCSGKGILALKHIVLHITFVVQRITAVSSVRMFCYAMAFSRPSQKFSFSCILWPMCFQGRFYDKTIKDWIHIHTFIKYVVQGISYQKNAKSRLIYILDVFFST